MSLQNLAVVGQGGQGRVADGTHALRDRKVDWSGPRVTRKRVEGEVVPVRAMEFQRFRIAVGAPDVQA